MLISPYFEIRFLSLLIQTIFFIAQSRRVFLILIFSIFEISEEVKKGVLISPYVPNTRSLYSRYKQYFSSLSPQGYLFSYPWYILDLRKSQISQRIIDVYFSQCIPLSSILSLLHNKCSSYTELKLFRVHRHEMIPKRSYQNVRREIHA